MMLISSLKTFGRYCMFICRVFHFPDKWNEFGRCTIFEVSKLGVGSIPITIIISLFIGAVIAIQMQLNIMSPLLFRHVSGLTRISRMLKER